MNWGAKIIIAFICFTGIVFTMVFISMRQDISLVADNYYEQEIAYEEQIQRIKNQKTLGEKPLFKVVRAEQKAVLTFPETLDVKEGTVHFFRPSNARMDRSFSIQLGEGRKQEFDLQPFRSGLWKVKIFWKSAEKEYYEELHMIL